MPGAACALPALQGQAELLPVLWVPGQAAARRQRSVRGERPIFIAPLVGSCFLVSDCKQI